MKRIISGLMVFTFFVHLSAQMVSSDPSISTPSASAGSFGKYVEVPVSLYTGTPSISVPIYQLSEGPLSLQLALNYHAAGNRVSEVGSPVGLGWTLNTGGMIMRTVRGIPDDKNDSDDLEGYFYNPTGVSSSSSWREDAAKGKRDSEPDLFILSAPGLGTIKFTYDWNLEPHTIPRSKIKIEKKHNGCATLVGFKVIGTDGTVYWFGIDPGDFFPCSPFGLDIIFQRSPRTYHENFHLERIISADERHEIDLEYMNSDYEYQVLKPCKALLSTLGLNDYGDCDDGFDDHTIAVRDKVISSITTSTASVSFDHFERLDLDRTTILQSYIGQSQQTLPLGIDNIKISEGDYDIKYELSHGYFNDSNGSGRSAKRLRLDQVQLVSLDDPSLYEPPYRFDYHNGGAFFAHRLTPRIDHWGYYNGVTTNDNKDNLIPQTTVLTPAGKVTYGSTNRNTSEAHMKFGQLTKVTYPTQGYTEFTYESNQYQKNTAITSTLIDDLKSCSGTGGTCCDTQNNSTDIVLTQQMINTGTLRLNQDILTSDPCFSSAFKSVTVKIQDLTTGGNQIWSMGLNSSINDFMTYDLDAIPGLLDGHNYRFIIESYFCIGRISVFYKPGLITATCGGLRIKQIKTHDDISTSHDIIKNYKYEDATVPTLASGVLYNQPEYGYRLDPFALFNSNSVRPLSGFDGYHVGYQRVLVEHNGNGSEEHTFHMDDTEDFYGDYPPTPPRYRPRQGVESSASIWTQAGTEIQRTDNYLDTITNLEQHLLGFRYTVDDLSGLNWSSNLATQYPYETYVITTDLLRPLHMEHKVDGVTVSTDYTYPATTYHYQPNTVTTWNSDGKAYRTDYKYTSEYSLSAAIRDTFRKRNILSIPYQTLQRVNGVVLDGSRTQYELYNASGNLGAGAGADPYPRLLREYQRTWANGVLQAGSWSTEKTMINYNSDGLLKTVRGRGWSNTVYDYYPNKLLKSKTFQGHVNQYTYKPGTRLLDVSTAVDVSTTTYNYDDLMRLSSVTDNCNGAATDYMYQFYNTPGSRSYIQTTNSYPADPSGRSDLTSTVSKAFMDGLGRSIETLKVAQTQDGLRDIIHAVEYDNQGRKWKSFEPIAHSSTGNYFNLLFLTQYAHTGYEPSPLNRIATQSHTDWYQSNYEYGANTSADAVANHDSGGNFAANSLIKSTVIDPNNNRLTTFTDKRGRTVLSRRTNSTGGGHVDTYTLYDDKDRTTLVIPPGATPTSSDLTYSYVYDKEDHVIKKKIPGKDPTFYWYNTRDLLSASRDAILENRGLWYAYEYDPLGREISSGFYTSDPGTSGSFSNLTPTEKLTENIYGTTAFEKDKIKTNRTRLLDRTDWLEETYTYFNCGTIHTSTSNNHLDLVKNDVTSFAYDGAHNVVSSSYLHSTPIKTLTLANYNNYDHVGRPDEMSIGIDGTIYHGSTSQYSHKEELLTHSTGIPGGNVLQQCDYNYRHNGMLTDINIGSGSQSNDLFSYELQYDTAYTGTGATIRKNGDIINTVWRTNGGNQRIYSYNYDYLDRLTSATYKEQDRDNAYNTTYTYESGQRGNLDKITRQGYHLENGSLTSGLIDNLNLNYSSGNRLSTVLDFATGSMATEGFYKNQAGFYEHDGNGNVTREPNKEYHLYYNHLNLVDSIVYDDARKYEFTYDATGSLLQKRIYLDADTRIEKHDYINGIEYINGDIESIYTLEGRIVNDDYFPDTLYVIDSIHGMQEYAADVVISNGSVKDHPNTTEIEMLGEDAVVMLPGFKVESVSEFIADIQNNSSTGWRAEYTVSDHLGNTRLVYSDLNGDQQILPDEIIQENHYYPYGLKQNGDWQLSKDPIAYGYNGMELLDEFGLDLNMTTYRMLDPSIGRWLQSDPKSEALYSLSPYQSMNNNPISYADPEGDIAFVPILVGAAIGAGVSGATTIATNAIAGNNLFQGFGKAVAMGAVGGAIGAGISGAFAGSAFGQSTGFGILNNVASNAATSAAFGQDITLGSLAGSVAGGVVAGQLPQFSGVQGGSLANAFAEIGHKSVSGAITGAVGGGIGAAIDGGNVGDGILNGAKYGAIGGGVQAGLNIATMGTAYIPDDVEQYGDFGRYKPVYRRGTFLYGDGAGIALGRNLVTRLTGDAEYDRFLIAHETGHFVQQRQMGLGKMYGKTARDYLKYGHEYSYYRFGTLEMGANMYSYRRLGYYFLPNGRIRDFR